MGVDSCPSLQGRKSAAEEGAKALGDEPSRQTPAMARPGYDLKNAPAKPS